MDAFRLVELSEIVDGEANITVNVDGYDIPVCGFTYDERTNSVSLILDEEFDEMLHDDLGPDEDEDEDNPVVGDVCNLPERSATVGDPPEGGPKIQDL